MITFYRHSDSKIIIIIRGFPVCATFRFVCLVKETTTRTRPLIKHELSPKTERDSHSTHTHTHTSTHNCSNSRHMCVPAVGKESTSRRALRATRGQLAAPTRNGEQAPPNARARQSAAPQRRVWPGLNHHDLQYAQTHTHTCPLELTNGSAARDITVSQSIGHKRRRRSAEHASSRQAERERAHTLTRSAAAGNCWMRERRERKTERERERAQSPLITAASPSPSPSSLRSVVDSHRDDTMTMTEFELGSARRLRLRLSWVRSMG